jgi:DNA-binding transcriptional LysR family regulator
MDTEMQLSDRIGCRMKLRDIHILMAVVQAGSMSKAAALLSTSQSAISRTIADLELAVGARLLDRSTRGIEPTQYGRALLKRGVVVFDELKQSVQDIRFLSDPGAGELRIGSNTAVSEGLVLSIIGELSLHYPRVAFHVRPGGTLALHEELRERRVELAFVRLTEIARKDDLETEMLFNEPLVVVVSEKNSWARRNKIELAELINEPWTWPSPGTMFDFLVVKAFRARGLEPPRATVYADTISMRTRLAENGRFLAVIPASTLKFRATPATLRKLPVELPMMDRQMGLVTLKDRTLSPLAQLFIEKAREIAKLLANDQ